MKSTKNQSIMAGKAYSYIRFSSPLQAQGDSLRRQIEATAQYCKEKGLILDTTRNLTDLGLSAFTAKHKSKGALGAFLRLVEAGEIERGSILIVENLDRLSREDILSALTDFMKLVQAGIKIVTLSDGQEYDQESIQKNNSQLIISITLMSRAHEESMTKSKRIKAAWGNRRKQAEKGRPIPGRVPEWIGVEVSEDKQSYFLKKDVCRSIEMIYRLKLDGLSKGAIVRKMNQMDDYWKPPKKNKRLTGGWRESYVSKLLQNNRALIGEFQPHHMIDGKRVPIGNVIKNHYPAAIPKDLFDQVQMQISLNAKIRGRAGGKTGKHSNLFTHLLRCGLCKAPLHYVNKGEGVKGGQYLICDSKKRKLGCEARPIKYQEFEKLFLNDFEELNLAAILPSAKEHEKESRSLMLGIHTLDERIEEIKEQQTNLIEQLLEKNSPEFRKRVSEKYDSLVEDRERLIKDKQEMEQKYENLTAMARKSKSYMNDLRKLLDSAEAQQTPEEAVILRRKINLQLKEIIEWLEVFPLMKPAKKQAMAENEAEQSAGSQWIDKVKVRFKPSMSHKKVSQVMFFQGKPEIIVRRGKIGG